MESSNAKRKQEAFKDKFTTLKEYGYCEDMNYPLRYSMEDFHFYVDDCFGDGKVGIYGVLDGHGGGDVVEYVNDSWPKNFKNIYKENMDINEVFDQTMKKVDTELKLVGASESGTTVIVSMMRKEQNDWICYVANIGDSRGVLNENGNAKRISYDHKATDEPEQNRIKQGGGMIIRGRVSGQLAVTRALGDLDLKEEGVINTPYVGKFTVSSKSKYLIMASDGLWDTCTDQKAVDLTKSLTDAGEMAKTLVDYALKNGSRDNTSVMILKFA